MKLNSLNWGPEALSVSVNIIFFLMHQSCSPPPSCGEKRTEVPPQDESLLMLIDTGLRKHFGCSVVSKRTKLIWKILIIQSSGFCDWNVLCWKRDTKLNTSLTLTEREGMSAGSNNYVMRASERLSMGNVKRYTQLKSEICKSLPQKL